MVSNRLRRECSKIFREMDFPLEMDQMQVLSSLYYSGTASQQEICYNLQRDKASVNRTVAFLLKNDLVTVSPDAADKRKTSVALTGAGRQLAIRVHVVLEEFEAKLVANLTDEEQMHFEHLMKKLIAIVAPM